MLRMRDFLVTSFGNAVELRRRRTLVRYIFIERLVVSAH